VRLPAFLRALRGLFARPERPSFRTLLERELRDVDPVRIHVTTIERSLRAEALPAAPAGAAASRSRSINRG
jgi:hypothetical protein